VDSLIINYLRKYQPIQRKFYNKKLDTSFYGYEVLNEIKVVFAIDIVTAKNILIKWLKNRKYRNLEIEQFKFETPQELKIVDFTRYEPKRNDRWLLKFPEALNIPQWVVKDTQRPKLDKRNGNQWDDITISFNDPIGPSTTQAIYNSFINNESISYTLEMLDPTGVTIEKWEISGLISMIDFGKLSYLDESTSVVTLTFKPNTCTLIY